MIWNRFVNLSGYKQNELVYMYNRNKLSQGYLKVKDLLKGRDSLNGYYLLIATTTKVLYPLPIYF